MKRSGRKDKVSGGDGKPNDGRPEMGDSPGLDGAEITSGQQAHGSLK